MKLVVFPPGGTTGKLEHDAGWSSNGTPEIKDGRPAMGFEVAANTPDGWGASIKFYQGDSEVVNLRGKLRLQPELIYDVDDFTNLKLYSFRKGLVRAAGHSFADDGGQYHPFGSTLFWALRGWKDEQDRIIQHFDYLRNNGYHCYRALMNVDWPNGLSVDSSWPMFQNYLDDMTGVAFKEYGLRIQPTLWGGNSHNNIFNVRDKVIEVLNHNPDRVQFYEVSNESYNLGPDSETLKQVGRSLRVRTPNLVALSAPFASEFDNIIPLMGDGENANLITAHYGRENGDEDWKFVRQVWDANSITKYLMSNNEGKGPLSSVSSTFDVLRLTNYRMLSHMTGNGMFVLHNGAGVYGVPNGVRPANLWETPNIDKITAGVRNAVKYLPAGVEGWTKANWYWNPPFPVNPLRSLNIYPANDGPISHYCCRNGKSFFTNPHAILDHFEIRALEACKFTVYDLPEFEEIGEYQLNYGQTLDIKVSHQNRDNAFLIKGEVL